MKIGCFPRVAKLSYSPQLHDPQCRKVCFKHWCDATNTARSESFPNPVLRRTAAASLRRNTVNPFVFASSFLSPTQMQSLASRARQHSTRSSHRVVAKNVSQEFNQRNDANYTHVPIQSGLNPPAHLRVTSAHRATSRNREAKFVTYPPLSAQLRRRCVYRSYQQGCLPHFPTPGIFQAQAH